MPEKVVFELSHRVNRNYLGKTTSGRGSTMDKGSLVTGSTACLAKKRDQHGSETVNEESVHDEIREMNRDQPS